MNFKQPHNRAPAFPNQPIRSGMASRPSSTRLQQENGAARARQDERLAQFGARVIQPGVKAGETRDSKFQVTKGKVVAGIAALGLAAGAAHAVGGSGESGPVNPHQNAIEQSAADNMRNANAREFDANAKAAEATSQPTQADIERLQSAQAELNRPPSGE